MKLTPARTCPEHVPASKLNQAAPGRAGQIPMGRPGVVNVPAMQVMNNATG